MKEKRGWFSYTDFECIKFSECCKAGYDVYVIKKDIDKNSFHFLLDFNILYFYL